MCYHYSSLYSLISRSLSSSLHKNITNKKINIKACLLLIFLDALSDILGAFKEEENFQRLEEAKISAGNDMLRTMQIVFPVATNIQMEVIEKYGFAPDGEGMCTY